MTSPDERRTPVGFRNGAFTADHPTCVGHPRVWGNGIPIKIAWALKLRSEFWAAPGDTCAWASINSINKASLNPEIYLVWIIYEDKNDLQVKPVILQMDNYKPFRAAEWKNARIQWWNFVKDDETRIFPLYTFLDSGYRGCGIEWRLNIFTL